jgi:subtilisin family serine protease
VEYAEHNMLLRPLASDDSDPLYYLQWALHNTGQFGGTEGADIDAENAWTLSTGDADIVVAVLDCGIDTYHPELIQNLWHNPGETPDNNQDDDHNGFVDDYDGWHWGPDVPEQERKNPNPYGSSHATEIAGIIGAAWDNDAGIKGICQNVRIMNLNLDGDTWGWDAGFIHVSDMINAIDYAIQNGASVISCSQGWHRKLASVKDPQDEDNNIWNEFLDNKSSFEAAINRARDRGVLFVTAAGNYNMYGSDWYDVDSSEASHVYPGCFPEDNIINVMATQRDDNRGDYSMYGQQSVDLGAPGDGIVTTGLYYNHTEEKWYVSASGTSQAAPHVAGVAALLLSKCPALTYGLLKSRLMDTGESLSALQGKCVSGKRLNAYNALYDPLNQVTPSSPTILNAYATAWNTIVVNWQDNSSNEIGYEIQRYNSDKPVFHRYASVYQQVTTFVDQYAYTRSDGGGIVHSYRVRAGNVGGGMSAYSGTVYAYVPYTVPVAPSNLAAETNIIPNIVLTWNDNANNEQSFIIERKKTGPWTQLTGVGPNTTTYTDRVTQTGTYYYRIKAQNPVGNSSYSNQITVVVEDW